MIIKTSLSWHYIPEETEFNTIIKGYYDTQECWVDISRFYLEKTQAEILVVALSRYKKFLGKIYWEGEAIRSEMGSVMTIIAPEILLFRMVERTVYALSPHLVTPPLPFGTDPAYWTDLDRDRQHDKASYMPEDIYDAVLHGIQQGIAAGMEGKATVKGIPPEDYAWKYVDGETGSLEQG